MNVLFESSADTAVDPISAHKHVVAAVDAAPNCALDRCNSASSRWAKAREIFQPSGRSSVSVAQMDSKKKSRPRVEKWYIGIVCPSGPGPIA